MGNVTPSVGVTYSIDPLRPKIEPTIEGGLHKIHGPLTGSESFSGRFDNVPSLQAEARHAALARNERGVGVA